METISSNLASIQEAAGNSSGVVEDPYLEGGFLIGSSLLGLLVIIGAFLYNRHNLSLFKRSCLMTFTCLENRPRGVQLIYGCLSTLLIMDALNLIVTIILGTAWVSFSCYTIQCNVIDVIWFLTRWFGVIIHLVNASLSIYNLHQPLSVARVCIAYALVFVAIFIIIILFVFGTKAIIFTLAAFMFLFALSVIITSRAPTLSPSTSTLKKLIVAVAMCNFLVVYVPFFILQCLYYTADLVNYQNTYVNVLTFTNLHLIFDGLQCALFLKLPSGEEQQQQQQQQMQQWQQQQPQQQQQQQQLSFQNAGFTGSTNVDKK